MWTPDVFVTPRQPQYQVESQCDAFATALRRLPTRKWPLPRTELIVVDEADRLRPASLEQLRDFYDRRSVGLVLIDARH
jgi:DNA transposition AAA+ family ATPase